MGLRDDRESAVLETLDEIDLPQRPVAVELAGLHPTDQVAELIHASRPGQRASPYVVVDVEVLVIDPDRVGEVAGHHPDLLPIAGHQADAGGDEIAERLVVELTVA